MGSNLIAIAFISQTGRGKRKKKLNFVFRIRVTGKAQSMRHDTRTKLRTWHEACDCMCWCMCVSLCRRVYVRVSLCVCVYMREGSARPKSTPTFFPQIPRTTAACNWHETFFFFFFFFFFASPYKISTLYTFHLSSIWSKLGYHHRHRRHHHHCPMWLLLFANVAAILPPSPITAPPSLPPHSFWTS